MKNTNYPQLAKGTAVIGFVIIFAGIVQVWFGKNGLIEWIRITLMSYEEVSETPFLAIWTSGRAAAGILTILFGVICLVRAFTITEVIGRTNRRRQSREAGASQDA